MGNYPNLQSKKIILAVTGSIAAYKSLLLTRLLIKSGAEVQVLMTDAATKFVSPLSFATLSKKKVHTQIMDDDAWNNHVDLGLWADAMIVAPATANSLAKMAHGITDTIIHAVYLSAKCPVFFAPAMDLDMWKHPSTVNNIELLKTYGNIELEVGVGELASGLVGAGRMAEPEDILHRLNVFFEEKQSMTGKKIMITAGPTLERLDPVRFISNHSSGKMGIALANAFASVGASVELILGPTSLNYSIHPSVNVKSVESAEDMYQACIKSWPNTDAAIMAAAVADYRPRNIADKKIKKSDDDLSIELERTKDIAKELGKTKKKHQILIGFALETNDGEANAKAKITKKNFDFIVLNRLGDAGAGFKHDTNKVSIISKTGTVNHYPLKAKSEVAKDILVEVQKIMP